MDTNLNLGIQFEEDGTFLKWGKAFNPLFNEYGGNPEIVGKFIHFNWGKRKILNGLELELFTSFANIGYPRWFRKKFNKLESWVIGDEAAISEFQRISSHLNSLFGQAIEIEDNQETREKYELWKVEGVAVSIYLFEQHCFKLHFLVEKLK